MKVNFLDVEPLGETREISKIPAKENDEHQVDFDAFGGIITFSRRDIVSDLLKVYLKFSAECNLMSNRGGETVDSKLGFDYETITFGEKDLHPRFIGYAFFSMASNLIGNWEDRYLDICKRLTEEEKRKQTDEEEEQKEINKTLNTENEVLFSPTQQEEVPEEIVLDACTDPVQLNP